MEKILQEDSAEDGQDFYSENYLEESIDSDEISSGEEGFMIGYMRS